MAVKFSADNKNPRRKPLLSTGMVSQTVFVFTPNCRGIVMLHMDFVQNFLGNYFTLIYAFFKC